MTNTLILDLLPTAHPEAWHHGGPPVLFPFFLFPLLFWALLITGVVGLRRGWWGAGRFVLGGRPAEEQGLREAYARGEIDEEVYRRRLEVLRATRESRR
jgi:putative membrane protein